MAVFTVIVVAGRLQKKDAALRLEAIQSDEPAALDALTADAAATVAAAAAAVAVDKDDDGEDSEAGEEGGDGDDTLEQPPLLPVEI